MISIRGCTELVEWNEASRLAPGNTAEVEVPSQGKRLGEGGVNDGYDAIPSASPKHTHTEIREPAGHGSQNTETTVWSGQRISYHHSRIPMPGD